MRHAKGITNIFIIIFLFVLCCQSCTPGQDATNFNKFLNQDTLVKGKAGILITALGQPENYDYTFFDHYLNLIFNAAFPWYLKFIIMRDGGSVLRDPENLFAQEKFEPKTLMDCFGKIKNSKGVPYTELDVKWVKPRKGSDGGHFLWEQKNGYVDIALKKLMAKSYPETPIRTASAMYPETIENAINELIKENVETIVVCDLFPVYSNLEEFNSLFIEIDHLVAERAKVIYAPSIGAFTSFRSAFVQMARDEITKISSNSKKLFVLTRHGFPEMPGEPYHKLAPAYYDNLQREVATALQGTGTDVVFADTEFAGEDDDPDNKRLSSSEALTMGLEKKYDYIVFILVDFLSENTDTTLLRLFSAF